MKVFKANKRYPLAELTREDLIAMLAQATPAMEAGGADLLIESTEPAMKEWLEAGLITVKEITPKEFTVGLGGGGGIPNDPVKRKAMFERMAAADEKVNTEFQRFLAAPGASKMTIQIFEW